MEYGMKLEPDAPDAEQYVGDFPDGLDAPGADEVQRNYDVDAPEANT